MIRKSRGSARALKGLYLALVLAFLYLPILVMFALSFNASVSRAEWTGFTLDWYRQLLSNGPLLNAALNSLYVALLSALFATILGVLAALCLRRNRFPGRKILLGAIYVLTVSPEMVMGISLLIFFIALHLPDHLFQRMFLNEPFILGMALIDQYRCACDDDEQDAHQHQLQ